MTLGSYINDIVNFSMYSSNTTLSEMSKPTIFAQSIITSWLNVLEKEGEKELAWPLSAQPADLITSSTIPVRLTLGTGTSLLSTSILPACAATTQHELIFVTCFWAASPSLRSLAQTLRSLSSRALAGNQKIRVRIGFSSFSLWQKLWQQPASRQGQIWGPERWQELGLPGQEELAGLDLRIKSLFVRPVSIMHPKFVIVDRETLWLPSCNVSWEDWFEGCLEMRGEMVDRVLRFYDEVWEYQETTLPVWSKEQETQVLAKTGKTLTEKEKETTLTNSQKSSAAQPLNTGLLADISFDSSTTTTSGVTAILLPSPHHTDPRFRPWPLCFHPPPPTPLNIFLLHAFEAAQSSIYIQSPNITCPAVLAAVQAALARGVDVHLVTSRRQQLLEQLLTAATITQFELWKLQRAYRQLQAAHSLPPTHHSSSQSDLESARLPPGQLRISWFTPLTGTQIVSLGNGEPELVTVVEPVKTHFKCVIVDAEIAVLGSGNMDRASWYTSQELGVAVLDPDVVGKIRDVVLQTVTPRMV